jgi:hypothetical protein
VEKVAPIGTALTTTLRNSLPISIMPSWHCSHLLCRVFFVAVYTSGKGSSAAGLTASVIKEQGPSASLAGI